MLLSKIRPGELDIRLVIESNTPTRDSVSNEEQDGWSVVSTVSAKRMPNSGGLGGRFNYEGNQQVNTDIETYLIRYSTDVSSLDASMRVFEHNQDTPIYFYVTNVEAYKRERQIIVTAEYKDN